MTAAWCASPAALVHVEWARCCTAAPVVLVARTWTALPGGGRGLTCGQSLRGRRGAWTVVPDTPAAPNSWMATSNTCRHRKHFQAVRGR